MHSEHRRLGAALAALLAAACADPAYEGAPTFAGVTNEPASQLEASARPEGWGPASHDPSAAPDHARVFPDERVPRIDIEVPTETLARMYDDLTQRIGAPSTSGTGGFGGLTSSSPAGLAACTGRAANEPCAFLGLKGTCAPPTPVVPDFGGRSSSSRATALTCRELDTGGALDMIPGDPIAVDVTVRVDEGVWTHVGMRFKGNSSLVQPWKTGLRKLGLRLDFDRFEGEHPETANQRFWGFSKLVLNPAHMDTSLIREKLASDLLHESGLPAAHAAFYRVYVRSGDASVYWGLYTALEDPADVLPRTQFPDGSGNVYKPDGNGADFSKLDRAGFEKKTNAKAADYGDVERAIAALHAPRSDAARWRSELEQSFDVDAFLRTLAFNRAIDNYDSYGTFAHNYYLYGDPSHGGRLVWISWDHNFTWSAGFGGFGGRGGVMMDETGARWPLVRFLLDDPVYRARYRDALTAFVRGPYAKEPFEAHARRLHALIAPYVVGEEGERAPYTHLRGAQSFESALPALLNAADTRRKAVVDALAKDVAQAAPASTGAAQSE